MNFSGIYVHEILIYKISTWWSALFIFGSEVLINSIDSYSNVALSRVVGLLIARKWKARFISIFY